MYWISSSLGMRLARPQTNTFFVFSLALQTKNKTCHIYTVNVFSTNKPIRLGQGEGRIKDFLEGGGIFKKFSKRLLTFF